MTRQLTKLSLQQIEWVKSGGRFERARARGMNIFTAPRARIASNASPNAPGLVCVDADVSRRRNRREREGLEDDASSVSANDDDDSELDSDDDEEEEEEEEEEGSADAQAMSLRAVTGAGDGKQVVVTGADGVAYGVWRCALYSEREDVSAIDAGSALRALVDARERPWVVVLARGGAFAASVFDVRKFEGGGDAPKAAAVEHATASRYVVRAKAGGRQVSKDAGGKNIKSAGSSMRRQNEAALEADMRTTFENWKDIIARASRIFISVSKVDARTLFDSKNPMLDRKDPRIRRIPFMTQKPTFNETRRVVGRLAAVNTNVVAEPTVEDLTELAETNFIIAAKPKPAPEPVVEEPVEPELPEPELHVAARAGDAERVFALLMDATADPTEVYRGKLPYAVCKTRETRDAFRRAMARMPEAWDWSGAAAVPSALTEDLEAKHAAKEAEYEAARKAKEKERKKAQKERKKKESSAAALLAKMTPPPPAEEPGTKKSATLVDSLDKATKDRREQMALAAERRMQALAAAKKANLGALGGVRHADAGTFGGGSYSS